MSYLASLLLMQIPPAMLKCLLNEPYFSRYFAASNPFRGGDSTYSKQINRIIECLPLFQVSCQPHLEVRLIGRYL